MKAALVGVGMVADMHVRAIANVKNLELSGVFSRNKDRCETFAQKYGLNTYSSLSEIAKSDVEYAIIATPPNARFDVIAPLIEAGKHILLEKPVARTFKDAQAVVNQCDQAGVKLGILLQHRMRKAAQILKENLSEGRLGTLTSVEITVPWWRPQSYYDAPGRGSYDQDGGGVLITQAIHTLDLVLQLAGPISRVQAMARTSKIHNMESENIVNAGLEFANGATGSLFATTTSFPGGPERITLHGTKASAILEGDTLLIRHHDGTETRHEGSADTGGGADPMAFTHHWHQAVIEDFTTAIAEDREPAISGRSALSVHALINACIRSSNEGRILEVHPHV